MTLLEAMQALRDGKAVTRKEWNCDRPDVTYTVYRYWIKSDDSDEPRGIRVVVEPDEINELYVSTAIDDDWLVVECPAMYVVEQDGHPPSPHGAEVSRCFCGARHRGGL